MSENRPLLSTPSRWTRTNITTGVGLIVIYVAIVIVLSLLSPFFLTLNNILRLLNSVAVLGMISVFATMLMIAGGLDLSVGANTALVGVVLASLSESNPLIVSVGASLLVGLIIGVLNGLLVTRIGINPLITTLGTLSIVRGLAFVFSGGLSIPLFDLNLLKLGQGMIAGIIPIAVVVLGAIFLVAMIVMHTTVYGRALYAIGGNSRASYLAGLPVKRIQMIAYVLSGVSAAVAGIFLTTRLGAAAPQASFSLELSVVAAVILGGTSLNGGKGSLSGTLLGVLILGTLNNGLTLLSVSAYYQNITLGIVLLLAVGLDQLRVGGLSRLLRVRS